MILQTKIPEFSALFGEFVTAYLNTPKGDKHIHEYADERGVGRKSFEEIRTAADSGEDITDRVLRKLLPHTNTAANHASGAWVHIAPAITGNIKEFFERNGWTRSEDWPKVSAAILQFVKSCADDPSQLAAAVDKFSALPYTTGLQTGMLTPILNAVRPNDFIILNNMSRKVINYFCGENLKQPISGYAAANAVGRALIESVTPVMKDLTRCDARPDDLFNMFSHWLIAVRQYAPIVDHKIKAGDHEIPASAPEKVPTEALQPEKGALEPRESYKIQAGLAQIGIRLGFRIWIPKPDRQPVLKLLPEVLHTELVDDLPLSYDGTTLKTIKNIDVIWLGKHSIERAFEVEHTTAIYSGLLRMSDLMTLVPGFSIPLYIVAPLERRDQVRQEILRPTFLSLKPKPLHEVCSFIPYSAVKEINTLPHLEHMKDSIIDKYRVAFGDDEDT